MGRRTILLVAAILVAALGTFLVFMYANRAEDAALAGQEPVQVLVATQQIPMGTAGSAVAQGAMAELKKLPAASVPPGALGDLGGVSTLVAVSPIYPGQVLLEAMFGAPDQASGGLALPKGAMGVSVQLGDPQRVAGFVQPGSEVAIFATSTHDDGTSKTGVLLDRVPVIAVGPTTTSTTSTTDGTGTVNTEAMPTAILTLALNQDQAQKVILATTVAPMYFALVNPDTRVSTQTPGTTTTDLIK